MLSNFPPEVSLNILAWLAPEELAQAAGVCKCWNVLCNEEELWKGMCKQRWSDKQKIPLLPHPLIDFKTCPDLLESLSIQELYVILRRRGITSIPFAIRVMKAGENILEWNPAIKVYLDDEGETGAGTSSRPPSSLHWILTAYERMYGLPLILKVDENGLEKECFAMTANRGHIDVAALATAEFGGGEVEIRPGDSFDLRMDGERVNFSINRDRSEDGGGFHGVEIFTDEWKDGGPVGDVEGVEDVLDAEDDGIVKLQEDEEVEEESVAENEDVILTEDNQEHVEEEEVEIEEHVLNLNVDIPGDTGPVADSDYSDNEDDVLRGKPSRRSNTSEADVELWLRRARKASVAVSEFKACDLDVNDIRLLGVLWSSVWKASYACAERDAQRLRMVEEDLFDREWDYIPSWTEGVGLVRFRRNGTRWCSMWGPPQAWILRSDGRLQVQKYPPYSTRRMKDWGWMLTSPWCEYRTRLSRHKN
ncbi:hypothetical protein BC829DRAFT_391116 [Chytridium lagenaria]|nr:hypothetical protein BC829DRAFT_391116 [Chytridium lagenaria]